MGSTVVMQVRAQWPGLECGKIHFGLQAASQDSSLPPSPPSHLHTLLLLNSTPRTGPLDLSFSVSVLSSQATSCEAELGKPG